MQLFFQESITSPTTYLTEEESKHLVRVLRKKQGDQIQITDGKGSLYTCVVANADPKKASLTVLSSKEAEIDPFYIHLAIAPTKSPDRMEWMVEKITEIGFHELTLLNTINGERSFLKIDRLQKKIISACKQSIKWRTPVVNGTTKLSELLKSGDFADFQKFIAYVDENHTHHLLDLAKSGQKYLILIGPEGDFDPKEIQLAFAHGFQAVSLGKSRLRTETAGLAAIQMLQVVNRYGNNP
jgi:16S rRNA (uracil1498-N3)-methyltransferase